MFIYLDREKRNESDHRFGDWDPNLLKTIIMDGLENSFTLYQAEYTGTRFEEKLYKLKQHSIHLLTNLIEGWVKFLWILFFFY